MIKISILHSNNPSACFDMGYYIDCQMPLAIEFLNTHPEYKGVSVERGLSGAVPGTGPSG